MTVQSANWLLIWAYAIGIFDLVSAIFFFLISLKTIFSRISWLSIFAVTFGLFWVTMIFMLLVGIHGRKPQCVRDWIIFCCIGIVFEMGLIVYAIFNDSTFNTGLLKNGILLIAGLVVECMFLYIIYRFYVTKEFCQNCQKPKLVDPCDKKKANKRQAKAKKKKLPKMRHKGKIVTNGPKILGGRTIANIPTQPLKLNRSSAASSEY